MTHPIHEYEGPHVAAAIWWRIKHEDNHSLSAERVLHARGQNGTAVFHVKRVDGKLAAELVRYESKLGHKVWDEDNANPRRQSANTVTAKEALKLCADMIEACELRLKEAAAMYAVDPSMRDLYAEQGEARFLSAALELQELFTKNPEPKSWIEGRHNPIYGKLIDHTQAMHVAFNSEDAFANPWIQESRSARLFSERESFEEDVRMRRSRIFFVLGVTDFLLPARGV